VPIKSADKFEYDQSKGTLSLVKRPLLKNSPLGCFVNSPLVNIPQGYFLRSRHLGKVFRHLRMATSGSAPRPRKPFPKGMQSKKGLSKTFRFKNFLLTGLFRQTEKPDLKSQASVNFAFFLNSFGVILCNFLKTLII